MPSQAGLSVRSFEASEEDYISLYLNLSINAIISFCCNFMYLNSNISNGKAFMHLNSNIK